jgi:hypothetical protein
MKKLFYSILLCALLFTSCTRNEFEFSCNPELNTYIATHLDEVSQIPFQELTSSDLVFQQAAFRSFSIEKKREVWLQKIQTLIDSKMYSDVETNHLVKLKEHLTKDYFAPNKDEQQIKQRREFAASWISYAKNTLGWSAKDVAFVVYRLYSKQSQFDIEVDAINSLAEQATTDPELSCHCSSSTDFCSLGVCVMDGCKSSLGCGWFWTENCDGNCRS